MEIQHSLGFLLLVTYLCKSGATCPSECSCYLDTKGRNTVECKEGGMIGPLSLTDTLPTVEVLKITAPEDNTNMLTMSPVLQGFKKLEEVHITRSNIPILGMHFFYGLKKLEVLNLAQNNITQPLDHNFRGLYNLKELCLDDNRIYSLPSGTFRYLPELRILSIQRNRIKELQPRMFQQLGKLKVLKLSGNNIGDLHPEVFQDIQELKVLECRGCALKEISPTLYENLPHLTHLDLGDNEIKNLPAEDLQGLPELKSLKFDGNHISTISDFSFRHQTKLKRLILSRNRIHKIAPGAFVNLHNVSEIDLGQNRLEYIHSGVFSMVSDTLERLVLSGNHIPSQDLLMLFGKLTNLKELYLSDIGLADVTSSFVPPNVNVLSLSGNYLSYIPPYVLPMNLVELDISRNRIRGMEEETVSAIENVPKLKLEGNPWSCDLCHILPLLSRVNKSSTMFNIRCVGPYYMEGKILGNIQKDDLSWCSGPRYSTGDANFFLTADEGKLGVIAAGASVLLLMVTVLAILAALCYSKRHAAKYYTHEEKRLPESEAIFETGSPLFGEDRELSFKFPLDADKKISIATIDEIKKDHSITNGT